MTRRIFCKVLLVVVAILGLLALSNVLLAQGNSANAFEHVREVQERNTERLMAMNGVEGTAIGYNENDRLAVKVFTAGPGVRGIPQELEGVPVQVVVTGKFYALPKPSKTPPGQAKKNRPPAAPTGLTATPVSSSQIDLAWNPNSEDDLDHYNVYCSGTSGGPYTQIGLAPKADDPTYSDAGLAAGTTYYYVVTAVDTAGKESDNSNQTSATTVDGPSDETPPAAPTGLTATAVSSSQIKLDWADNSESDLDYYNVYCSTTSGGPYSQIDSVGASEYYDTGLAPDTTYYYVVTAVDTSDNESANSDEASATTESPPEKPPLWCERPVPIGVSTGHPDITAGTIGCRVTDGINVYALSNNHVYANENKASIEDNVLQPGTFDGGVDPDDAIGTLFAFEPIVFHPRANNTIDAAIALTNTDMVGNATPSGGYGTPNSITAAAYVNQLVKKYGRSTGLTEGKVYALNAMVRVGYDSGTARFVGQIVITPGGFSDGGDSGSLIVTREGNNPVGLLFAGSSSYTIANPIDDVLDAFGVTIDGE
jgi:hypothetical protein